MFAGTFVADPKGYLPCNDVGTGTTVSTWNTMIFCDVISASVLSGAHITCYPTSRVWSQTTHLPFKNTHSYGW